MPRRRLPPWLLVSAAWCGPAFLTVVNSCAQSRLRGVPARSARDLFWQSGDWLLYGLLTPVVFWLSRRLPLRRGVLLRNGLLHFLLALALGATWSAIGTLLRWVVLGLAPDNNFVLYWFFVTPPFAVAAYFGVVGVEHATRYRAEAQDREVQSARLSQQLAEARLGALQMQLHPHFLFNTLNAILVSVRDADHRTAARMLELLGDMLRQILHAGPAPEISLTEELAFVEQYLAIEQIRFSDRLRVVIDVAPGAGEVMVPRFLLQPLVENAIRHGIAVRPDAGLLQLTARRADDTLVITVDDDGPGPPATPLAGVGLTNARERLATLYGAAASLTLGALPGGGARAAVRIPATRSAAGRG